MDRYEYDGMVFDLTDAGPVDGELVVLLHGYPETRESWDGVIPALAAAGYRVVAPDQRGYSPGARPTARREYRMELLVNDVLALLDAVGRERVHVVGHDWGGAVAWALAAMRPDRVLTVTSLATPHPAAMARSLRRSTQALRSWYFLFYQLPVLPEASVRGPAAGIVRRTLVRSGLPEANADRYLARLQQPGAARAAINWYRAVPFSRSTGTSRVSVPTLYVYATGDFALGRVAADLTGNYVDGPYQYELLDGVSHWIPEEEPDRVAALLLDHFRKHGEAR